MYKDFPDGTVQRLDFLDGGIQRLDFPDGVYKAFTFQMGAYKDFTGMTVAKYYTPDLPVGAAPKAGLDGNGNLFSNDQPVQFTISTSNNGEWCCFSLKLFEVATKLALNKSFDFFLKLF